VGEAPLSTIRSRGTVALVLALGSILAACGSSSPSASSTATSRSSVVPHGTLTIMVTNDDGVGAPGIDAVVQGLRTLPGTRVMVVAPLTDQSGTGEQTSAGTLVTSKAQTASGYPAIAVHGYPADTVIWAIGDHGLSGRPDLVVSGINFGQNVGQAAGGSGTVGAARQAHSFGIPALAASQGVDDGSAPEFSEAVPIVESWVTRHRSELVSRSYGSRAPQANLNVPTCTNGPVRGPVTTVMAQSGDANTTNVDCTSTSTSYADDLEAFELGFATLTPLYPPSG
jgi:5'-nucleotidase